MLKKSALIGLVLMLVGGVSLRWALAEKRKQQQLVASYKSKYASDMDDYFRQYNQWLQTPPQRRGRLPWGLDELGKPKEDARLRLEQHQRLKADLGKLLVTEPNFSAFADILYGPDWREELDNYKKQKEKTELVFTASIACTSFGGLVFIWCLLLWTTRLIIRASLPLKRFLTRILARLRAKEDKGPPAPLEKQPLQQSQSGQGRLNKYSEVLAGSGWQNFEPQPREKTQNRKEQEQDPQQHDNAGMSQKAVALSKRTRWHLKDKDDKDKKCSSGVSAEETEDFAVVISAENAADSAGVSKPATENTNEKKLKSGQPAKDTKQTGLSRLGDYSLKSKDIPVTQSLRRPAIDDSEPLANNLAELTREISAIREYASCQQDRVNKLQDGYDWNIIRNFCLRVIRCIDNLETRIARLAEQSVDTVDFEQVRDELVFALESSGLEQFEPKLHSDYRGQERFAEAVRAREHSDDPGLAGKIAKVLRPGYQYLIDEENAKVIRPAQVRLFSQVCK